MNDRLFVTTGVTLSNFSARSAITCVRFQTYWLGKIVGHDRRGLLINIGEHVPVALCRDDRAVERGLRGDSWEKKQTILRTCKMATRHRAVSRTDKQNFLRTQIRAPRDLTCHVQQNRIQFGETPMFRADWSYICRPYVSRGIQGSAR